MNESDIIICGHGSGRPRTTKMSSYLTSRYSKTVTKNGITWRKGLVAVMRPVGLTDELRKKYVSKYTTILGRNYYSQTKRDYCYIPYSDGNYYSDCSSSQCATLALIGLDMPSYNTVGIYESSRFRTVDAVIEKGHIINPEVLKVGDMLLFAGSDPDRVKHIGHVEGIYSIDGGGTSSTAEEKYQRFLNENYAQILKSYCGGLLEVDGEYGPKTRAASLAIWKYMSNKYYGTELTVGNDHFYSVSKTAAQDITNGEVAKHPTFGYILNGILTGRGYGSVSGGSITEATRQAIIKAQDDAHIAQTGRLSADLWYFLFN